MCLLTGLLQTEVHEVLNIPEKEINNQQQQHIQIIVWSNSNGTFSSMSTKKETKKRRKFCLCFQFSSNNCVVYNKISSIKYLKMSYLKI